MRARELRGHARGAILAGTLYFVHSGLCRLWILLWPRVLEAAGTSLKHHTVDSRAYRDNSCISLNEVPPDALVQLGRRAQCLMRVLAAMALAA